MKKMTIKDIARLAEVSITTVSKIINGKDHDISQATIERVKQIMQENRYVPNKLAGSLVTKTTKTIGLVIPDITNPFFPELVRGAEDRANEAGYSLFFCNSDDKLEKETQYIKSLMEKMVDGIIFTAASTDSSRKAAFKNISSPIVLVDRVIEMDEVKASIVVDNVAGAFEGTKYLIGLGHRKILHITGPEKGTISQERLSGYEQALNEAGIAKDSNLVLSGHFKLEWGYEAMAQAFKNDLAFTAVFCGNDLIALGAMKYLKEQGKRIPEDCSVLGYDDIQIASHVDPPLTTIRQPKYQMGYQAVDTMVKLLSKNELTPADDLTAESYTDGRKIVLSTELVIRQTCAPLKASQTSGNSHLGRVK